jgi:hypothetical protein
MSAATTGLNFYAQSEQAEAQNEYKQQRAEETHENAMESYRQQTNQEQLRVVQEQESASQEQQKAMLKQRKAAGEALASSQSAGVNVESLMSDYLRAEGNYRSAIDQQLGYTKQQSRQNIQGFRADARSRIAAGKSAPTQGPSIAGAVAGLGTKAASAYQTYSVDSGSTSNSTN